MTRSVERRPGGWRRLRRSALAVLLGVASANTSDLWAQGYVVIPPLMAKQEANGAAAWAAGPFTARRQLLLDGLWLQPAIGQHLTSLFLRRNQGTAADQAAGSLAWEVFVCHARHGPESAMGTIAANRGPDFTQVFSGRVSFPAAPHAPQTPAPWQAPFAVTVTFDRPFLYRGGPLLIETLTRPEPGAPHPWWPIDAEIAPPTGDLGTVGRGCLGAGVEPTAGAELGSVTVGTTAVFWLRGRLQAGPAFCMLGGSDTSYLGLPLPVDLTAAGAPGCFLYNDVVVVLPSLLIPLPMPQETLATAEVPIPNDSALAGGTLFAQWLTTSSGSSVRVRTSNGIAARIGALPASPGAAWVEAIGPNAARGRVLRDRCPVVRLDFRP